MKDAVVKRAVLTATFVVIAAFSCLLAGCKLLTAWQLKSVRVLGWEEDRYLWMAGNVGVVRWDVNQQVIIERTFFRPDGIDQFFVSKEGHVWAYGERFWAYGNGVWLFESEKWIETGETSGLRRGRIYDMVQTNDGIIWAATSLGFRSWNKETQLWEPTLIDQPGRTLVQGPDDSLWFGLAEDGILQLQSGELTHWTVADGLIDNEIRSLLVASDDSIWVGTSRGASHWDGNRWQGWEHLGYPDPDGLVVYKFYETSDGTIWAATSEGVARWDGKEWITYWSMHWRTIYTFLEADDGTFWVGCVGGLFRWIGDAWHEYTTTEGLSDNSWSRLVKGTNGTLYASTKGGIYQYIAELDRWQPFPNK